MAVPGCEFFTYIGYTLGGTKPTLYFKEGRYTQQHNNPANIGWHPIKTEGKHYQGNISAEDVRRFAGNKKAFAAEFIKRPDGIDSFDGLGQLLEVHVVDGKVVSTHISRSRLIRVGSPGFDRTYDAKYAVGVLMKGHTAPNSYHPIEP